MNLTVQGSDGNSSIPYMGCYGVGISRIVAASIEQNYDEKGIIWPQQIAPFDLHVVVLNPKNNATLNQLSEEIEQYCAQHGIEVIIDDRDLTPGNKFADADLIGCPHRLIVGEKGLKNEQIEYKTRNNPKAQFIPLHNWQEMLITRVKYN